MQLTNYLVLLASLRPIIGFITEILLETVSFSTINLLKCINLLYLRIKSGSVSITWRKKVVNSNTDSYPRIVIFFQILTIFYLIYPFLGWELLTHLWVHLGFLGFGGFFLLEEGCIYLRKKKKLTRIQIIFHIVPLQFFHLSLLNNFLLRKCSCLTIQAGTSTPHKLRSKLAVLDSLYYTPHPESDAVSQSRVSVLHILKII